ncbi:MAG: DMT family transporter [Acidiferrobacterales bacterium]|nr:DMT family transporter [Acidiferrobacterales bacterium]
MKQNSVLVPSLVVAISGAIWGLFWIPIRQLDAGGISAAWTSLITFGIAGLLFLFVFFLQFRKTGRVPWNVFITGLIGGCSIVFYAIGFVLTEVVKTILLIYLTPIWSIILGRFMLNEKITPYRIAAIVCGLAGMIVILEVLNGEFRISNAGDLIALSAGVLWSLATIGIRKRPEVRVWEQVGAFYIGGALVALLFIIFPFQGLEKPPTLSAVTNSLLWIVIFLVVFVSAIFLVFWGAQRLSPARVGLLLMTDVVCGVVSAAILAGEPFGWTQVIGVVLIVSAAIIDVFDRIWRSSFKTVK